MNITYAIADEYKELTDSLKSSIAGYELVIIKDKEIIRELGETIKIHDKIDTEKDIIIVEQEKDNKKLKRKNKQLKFFNKIFITTTAVLAVIVIILTL